MSSGHNSGCANHPIVVIIGVVAAVATIVVSSIAIFTIVTGKQYFREISGIEIEPQPIIPIDTGNSPQNWQEIYMANLSDPVRWPQRPDLVVSDGRLTFMPEAFEYVWSTDFSEELDDFVVSATFSYDTQSRNDVGVAIVVGDMLAGNFFFLGPNPISNNKTAWFFVMSKNHEHNYLHDQPTTDGQQNQYSVQLIRQGNQVSAYVNGQKLTTREDIVFEGHPALMQVGVNAEGRGVVLSLHELSVAIPISN